MPAGLAALASGQSLLNNPKALYAAAVALANQATAGPMKGLAAQLAASQNQTKGALNLTGGYFNALGQQAQSGLTSEGQIANDLNSQLAGIGANTQSQLQGLGQGAQASLSKYLPQGDQSVGAPAMQSLTAEIARQQGLAAQQQAGAQTAGAMQGANYRGLAASNVGTGALAGQEALSNIAQAGQLKNQGVQSQIAALRATRGADVASNLGKLRQQEISNAITEQGLNVKLKGIKATAANDKANRAQALLIAKLEQQGLDKRTAKTLAAEMARTTKTIAGEDSRTTQEINARAAAAAAKAAQGGGSSAGSLTTHEANTLYAEIGRIQALVKESPKTDNKGNALTPQLIWRHLQSGNNPSNIAFPRALIAAAFDLNKYGYITAQTAQGLRALGLQPQKHGLKIGNPAAQVPGLGSLFGG